MWCCEKVPVKRLKRKREIGVRFFSQAGRRYRDYFRVVRREGREYIQEGLGYEVGWRYGEAFRELELRGAACVRDQQ